MHLHHLKLFNFKNYKESEVTFSDKLNVFTGPNGSGKTNLLDAIHYLSSGRSALNSVDTQNINHNESAFSITGTFKKEDKKFVVSCQLLKGQKKTLLINKKKIERISDFIGNFPVVLITPDDNEVIKEGSEIRRSFFDNIFSQLDKKYLDALIEYSRALKIRNALLKQFFEGRYFDKDILDPYDQILATKGHEIHDLRLQYFQEFAPLFSYYFDLISGKQEQVTLVYKSSLSEFSLLSQLKSNIAEDRALQRTTSGVHKDDFIFSIGGHPLKKFGSQGQQKSFLVSLKLAHFQIIKKLKGIKSLLLLDDIFDKLDETRIAFLMKIVLQEEFGQVFITDARPNVSINYFKGLDVSKNFFIMENNNFAPQQL